MCIDCQLICTENMENPLWIVSTDRDSTGSMIRTLLTVKWEILRKLWLKILLIFLSVCFKCKCESASLKLFAFGSCVCVPRGRACTEKDWAYIRKPRFDNIMDYSVKLLLSNNYVSKNESADSCGQLHSKGRWEALLFVNKWYSKFAWHLSV